MDEDDIVIEISNSSASGDHFVVEDFAFPIKCNSSKPSLGTELFSDCAGRSISSIFNNFKSKIQRKPAQAYPEFETSPSWLVELRFLMNCLLGKMLNTINTVEYNAISNLKGERPLVDCELKTQLEQSCDILLGQHVDELDENRTTQNDLVKGLKEMLDIILKIKNLLPVEEENQMQMSCDIQNLVANMPSKPSENSDDPANVDTQKINESNLSPSESHKDEPTVTQNELGNADSHSFQIHEKNKSFNKPSETGKLILNLDDYLDLDACPLQESDSIPKHDVKDCLRETSVESFKTETSGNKDFETRNAELEAQSEKEEDLHDCKSCKISSDCNENDEPTKINLKTNSSQMSFISKNDEFDVSELRNDSMANKENSVAPITKAESSVFDYESSGLEVQLELLSKKPYKLSYDAILPDKRCFENHDDKKPHSPKLIVNRKKGILNRLKNVSKTPYRVGNTNKEEGNVSPASSASKNSTSSKREDFSMPDSSAAITTVRDRKPSTKRGTDTAKVKFRNSKSDFMESYTKVLDLRIKYNKLIRPNSHTPEADKDCSEPAVAKNQVKASAEEREQAPKVECQDKFYKEFEDYFEKMKVTKTMTQDAANVPKNDSESITGDAKHHKTEVVSSTAHCIKQEQITGVLPDTSAQKESQIHLSPKKEMPSALRRSFENLCNFMSPVRLFRSKQ